MNFDFPDETKQLRDQARKFLQGRCPSSVTRRILDGPEPYDRALWAEMAGLGWMGAAVPEQYGGLGMGHLAVCILAEEIGRAVAPVPFSSSVYLATEAILAFGSAEQKQLYLPRLASGEAIGTFAFAERPGPTRLARMTAQAIGGRLTGSKMPVPDGDIADFAVVAVRPGAAGLALHIVDLAGEGISREAVATFDPSRSYARIDFDRAPADPLPGAEGEAAFRAVLDRAAVLTAFEQVGIAQTALDMARDYAVQRYAFGRPIGSFQAIKHKLADVLIAVEIARSNAYYGAWALHRNAPELPIAAALSRVAAGQAGWLATKENIQTHGGMGYTWAMDCHLYYRRAKLLELSLGSTREWKYRLVAELRARNTADLAAA